MDPNVHVYVLLYTRHINIIQLEPKYHLPSEFTFVLLFVNIPCNSITYRVCVAVSLPRLVDLEWKVDMKTASDSVSRMAVPTCILYMKV